MNRVSDRARRNEVIKQLIVVLVVLAAGWGIASHVMSTGDPDVTVNGNEVLKATGDLDVRFAKGKAFEGTYMLFGGLHIDHHNAIVDVSLSGIDARKAKPIARRYPDFYRCASPGAEEAKRAVEDLNLVPADGEALDLLTDAIDEFERNIREGGDRVCVALKGARLDLESVTVREVGEKVTQTIQLENFVLVDSATRVDCKQVLGGSA